MKNTFNLQQRDLQCLEHPMILNWGMTNTDGNPALCCAVCVSGTKKRRGKPRYIRYIKTREIQPLIDLGIEEIF